MIDRPPGAFYILVKNTQGVAAPKRRGEINNIFSLEKEEIQ
jgi:hypothetical protein